MAPRARFDKAHRDGFKRPYHLVLLCKNEDRATRTSSSWSPAASPRGFTASPASTGSCWKAAPRGAHLPFRLPGGRRCPGHWRRGDYAEGQGGRRSGTADHLRPGELLHRAAGPRHPGAAADLAGAHPPGRGAGRGRWWPPTTPTTSRKEDSKMQHLPHLHPDRPHRG